MATSSKAHQQARSVRPTIDVRLIIAQSQATGQRFSIRVEQRGVRAIRGWIGSPNDVLAAALQELRQHYEQRIQAMRALASTGMPVPPPDERPLLELGRRVAALLPPSVRAAMIEAVEHARLRRCHLRLILEVTNAARALLSVPWELMVLPLGWGDQAGESGDHFLLLNANITLIRQVRDAGAANATLELDHPLRLQAFAATPLSVQPIDLHTTLESLKRTPSADQPDQQWYSGTNTLGVLLDRLRSAQPQIVHLVCHGEQSNTGHWVPRYDLLLTHADGYMQRVGGADLAGAFTLAPDLQLVILQACYAGATAVSSANGSNNWPVAESIALTLVRSGVPTVIAMQGEVSQPAAAAFASACYTSLASGVPVERAVAAGRLAMRAAGGIVDWSLPVVYQGNRQLRETWHTPLTNQLRKIVAARWSY
jgi:hypothetical protein